MKLYRFVALTVVVVVLQAIGIRAQVDENLSSRDARFLQKAAQLALFQFELGNLALTSGPTQEVRDYGLLVAADYDGINGRLAEIAAFHGLELPTTLTRSQQRLLDRLTALADTDSDRFLRTLLKQSISMHRQSIKLYQQEARKGQALDVTQFAEGMLPLLQEHLDQASELRSTLVQTSNRGGEAQRSENQMTGSNNPRD